MSMVTIPKKGGRGQLILTKPIVGIFSPLQTGFGAKEAGQNSALSLFVYITTAGRICKEYSHWLIIIDQPIKIFHANV